MCFGQPRDETLEQGGLWHYCVRVVVSIRANIACARARATSDDFKLTAGLALAGVVGIAGTSRAWPRRPGRRQVGSRWALAPAPGHAAHDRTSNPPTLHKVMIGAKLPRVMQGQLGAGRFRHGFPDPDGSLQGFPRRHRPGRLAVAFAVCSAAPCPAELPKLVHVSGVCSV